VPNEHPSSDGVSKSSDIVRPAGQRWGWKYTDEAYNRRWLARVKKSILIDATGCWLWRGNCTPTGYGSTNYRGNGNGVHRLMYQVHFGVKLETDQYVLHRCDVRRCCNPDHLWIGTAKDNNADCAKKGRHYEGSRSACERGHEFTPENTYIARNGSRNCRECQRIRMRGYWQNGKAKERQKRYREKLRAQKMGANHEQI